MAQKIISFDRGKPAYSLDGVQGSAGLLGDIISYVVDPHGHLPAAVSVQISFSVAPSNVSIDIFGSHDGTNWFVLANSTNVNGEIKSIANTPVPYLYGKVTSITGTPKVSISFCV